MTLPAFQAFYDATRGPVYRFLVATVGRQEADDCFQETFVSALRAYPNLRPSSRLDAWVMTIAHRKAIDHARAARRRPEPVEAEERVLVGAGAGAPAAARSAEAAALESQDGVWDEVRGLPPKQMAAVVLRHVNGLPYPEVARIIGCSEPAARRSVHEGLKKLREVLR
ncbi:MAG TPA: sigma-70 family RNA polymerase sigma factor [Candidatus Dormibacteraeota bacterium]|jgi:RNA polymerase sigma factor (sigma-70 family)|nr:sigma-70 family RNA polymerase sigma factor [Candidatus Dormibacteraeota bacterium]